MHPDRIAAREKRMLKLYNVTPEAYARQMQRQHGRCAGCGKRFNATRLPCIDHDHDTGLWRGLLCTDCNYSVGERHDDAKWFQAIANYLQNPPAAHERIYVPGSPGEAGLLDDDSD